VSLLTIVQTVAPRFGIAPPSIAASSGDQNILQLVAFINEDGQELAARHNWQVLTTESTFATLAAEIQGSMLTLAGADFSRVVNNTMWNRTQRWPVMGPKSPAEWQELKASMTTGPWQQYRIRGNSLLFLPTPSAGSSIYFEWITKNWATNAAGSISSTVLAADTDVSRLDERIHALGAIWRFKAAKKLEYSEDFDKYELAVADAMSRDGSKPQLNLGGVGSEYMPVSGNFSTLSNGSGGSGGGWNPPGWNP
jgi:hypothetical protein